MTACLFELLFMIPINYIASTLALPWIAGEEKTVRTLVVSLAFLGLFMMLRHWNSRLKYIVPGVLAVAFATVVLLKPASERVDFLLSNLWILKTAVIAAAAFALGWLWTGIRIARRICSFAVLVLLILNMVLFPIAGKGAVACGLFLLVLFVADEVQKTWKKAGDTDAKKHIVFLAPFFILPAVLVFVIPASEKPVDYSAVVRLFQRTVAYVRTNTVWLHRGEENYAAYIGFSDDGKFRRGLKGNDKDVMYVSAESGADPVLYLGGKTMDTFSGTDWSEAYDIPNNDRLMDTLELLSAIRLYDAEHEADYIRRTKVNLEYRDFYTRYCFAPSKLIPGKQRLGGLKCDEEGGDLIADEVLGYGSKYTAFYYRMNRNHEKFRELLAEDETKEEDAYRKAWEETCQKYVPGVAIPYEECLAYREKMKELYLPDTPLSSEAEAYLGELTKDSASEYETLGRIQEVLAEMQYSKTPGKLPENITSPAGFLDYFLFEKQEGYCTFYATAFVLMARNRGIPARMVQGFRVNPKAGQTVAVKSDLAHSWAEAYIEGVGWMIYDPTPGGMEENFWMSEEERASIAKPEIKPEISYGPDSQEGPLPVTEPAGKEKQKINPKVIWIPLLSVLGIFLLYVVLEQILARAAYKKKSPEERFLLTCRRNLRILGYLGYKIKPGETVEEFVSRTGRKTDSGMLAFLKDYERISYADAAVSERAVNLAEKNGGELLNSLKTVRGRRLHWLYLRIFC